MWWWVVLRQSEPNKNVINWMENENSGITDESLCVLCLCEQIVFCRLCVFYPGRCTILDFFFNLNRKFVRYFRITDPIKRLLCAYLAIAITFIFNKFPLLTVKSLACDVCHLYGTLYFSIKFLSISLWWPTIQFTPIEYSNFFLLNFPNSLRWAGSFFILLKKKWQFVTIDGDLITNWMINVD